MNPSLSEVCSDVVAVARGHRLNVKEDFEMATIQQLKELGGKFFIEKRTYGHAVRFTKAVLGQPLHRDVFYVSASSVADGDSEGACRRWCAGEDIPLTD